ncbi:MAG TPA: serine protease [Verrucomicrobiae bacterium]|nr:serine protease [Verrucomicrobiae bacterium]
MHQKLKNSLAISISAAVLTLSFFARADELSDKGRDIFNKHQHAVVTVQLVQKIAANGKYQARESKQEVTGTVLDSSGLTVLALSSCDPSELTRRMTSDSSLEIELSDIKIMLEDGTEIPADIVLRDKDLDLAFIRPKTKTAAPMDAIELGKASHAQVLDQLITLNRLKRAAGRAFSASVERISAVVQKPRTFYIPDGSQTDTTLGSPAFALDGNVVGLVVMRAVSAQGAASMRDCLTAIILPAEDIAKAASQAPTEVKPEEPKKDASAKTDAPKVPAKAP